MPDPSKPSEPVAVSTVEPAALAHADRVYAEVSENIEGADAAEPIDVAYLASCIADELQLDDVGLVVALVRRVIALENTVCRRPEIGELMGSTKAMLSRAYDIAARSEVLFDEIDGGLVEDYLDPDAFLRVLRAGH